MYLKNKKRTKCVGLLFLVINACKVCVNFKVNMCLRLTPTNFLSIINFDFQTSFRKFEKKNV